MSSLSKFLHTILYKKYNIHKSTEVNLLKTKKEGSCPTSRSLRGWTRSLLFLLQEFDLGGSRSLTSEAPGVWPWRSKSSLRGQTRSLPESKQNHMARISHMIGNFYQLCTSERHLQYPISLFILLCLTCRMGELRHHWPSPLSHVPDVSSGEHQVSPRLVPGAARMGTVELSPAAAGSLPNNEIGFQLEPLPLLPTHPF